MFAAIKWTQVKPYIAGSCVIGLRCLWMQLAEGWQIGSMLIQISGGQTSCQVREFAKLYLTNLVFWQTLGDGKSPYFLLSNSSEISSSPTLCHNSLDKPRSNLHQEPWEKQSYVCAIPPLENLHEEPRDRKKYIFMSFHLFCHGMMRWG